MKATLSLSHSLTCDTHRDTPPPPFFGSMAGTFVGPASITGFLQWAALCRLISECSCSPVDMSLLFLCAYVKARALVFPDL